MTTQPSEKGSLVERVALSLGKAVSAFRNGARMIVDNDQVRRPGFLSATAQAAKWKGGAYNGDRDAAQRRAVQNSWVFTAINEKAIEVSKGRLHVWQVEGMDAVHAFHLPHMQAALAHFDGFLVDRRKYPRILHRPALRRIPVAVVRPALPLGRLRRGAQEARAPHLVVVDNDPGPIPEGAHRFSQAQGHPFDQTAFFRGLSRHFCTCTLGFRAVALPDPWLRACPTCIRTVLGVSSISNPPEAESI